MNCQNEKNKLRMSKSKIILFGVMLTSAANVFGENSIEEVIVTATKRSQSIRDIPMSIEAFTGDQLKEEGLIRINDIIDRTPGVSYSSGDISMRGVKADLAGSPETTAEVSRFFGDVSLSAPSVRGALSDFDNYDMATVEILKGPQATLFGGGALAGAIRYVPNKPNLDSIEGAVRVSGGEVSESDHNHESYSAMFNMPVTEGLAVRIVASKTRIPGVVDDITNGREDVNSSGADQYRAIFQWDFLDRWSISGTALNWDDSSEFAFSTVEDEQKATARRSKEPKRTSTKVREARLTRSGDNVDIALIASNLKVFDNVLIDTIPVLGLEEIPFVEIFLDRTTAADVNSFEVRFSSSQPSESNFAFLNDWTYLVGLYNMDADQYAKAYLTVNVPASAPASILVPLGFTPGTVNESVDTDSNISAGEVAIFADITRPLFDGLFDLNLGFRYAETEVDIEIVDSSTGQPSSSDSIKDNESRFNPKIAFTWNIEENISLRASMAEGFRFGGANSSPLRESSDAPEIFKSDSLKNYELAFRSEFFQKSLRFDLTGYRIDWDDLQFTQFTDVGLAYIDNIGSAEIDGIESSLLWLMPDSIPYFPSGISVGISSSFIDAKTTSDFESEDGFAPSGTRLPLSSKQAHNIHVGWDGFISDFEASMTLNYSISGARSNALIQNKELPEYRLLSASARISNQQWPLKPDLSVSLANITNEKFAQYALQSTTDENQYAYILGTPKTLLVSLELSF